MSLPAKCCRQGLQELIQRATSTRIRKWATGCFTTTHVGPEAKPLNTPPFFAADGTGDGCHHWSSPAFVMYVPANFDGGWTGWACCSLFLRDVGPFGPFAHFWTSCSGERRTFWRTPALNSRPLTTVRVPMKIQTGGCSLQVGELPVSSPETGVSLFNNSWRRLQVGSARCTARRARPTTATSENETVDPRTSPRFRLVGCKAHGEFQEHHPHKKNNCWLAKKVIFAVQAI